MVFAEPRSLDTQLTGSWVTEDHLRFWSYNSDSNFAYHAGANGFANIQNTCIKLADFTQSSGQYVSESRRSHHVLQSAGQYLPVEPEFAGAFPDTHPADAHARMGRVVARNRTRWRKFGQVTVAGVFPDRARGEFRGGCGPGDLPGHFAGQYHAGARPRSSASAPP